MSQLRSLAAAGSKLQRVALELFFDEEIPDVSERAAIAILDLVQPAELDLFVEGHLSDARLGRILSRQKGTMTLTLWCALGVTGAFLDLAKPAPPLKQLRTDVYRSHDCPPRCWGSRVGSDFRGVWRFPELCSVQLNFASHFTDESAIALASARGLREVEVAGSARLTSKGIAAIAAHQGLRQLRIRDSPLDDDICPVLATNHTIVDLELAGAPRSITRRCLPHLAKMKSLRFRTLRISE